MDVKLNKIHIGQSIKEKLHKSVLRQTEFADKIGEHQGNLSKMFRANSIKTDKLIAICEALDYNFFADFCVFENEDTQSNESLPAGDYMDKYAKLVIDNYELKNEIEEKSKIIKSLEERLSKYEDIKKVGA